VKGLGVAAAIGMATPLLTPWGPRYAWFALKSALLPRPYVPEWSAVGLDVYGGCLALLVLLCIPLAWAKPRAWKELGILAVLAVEAGLHRRHLTLFAIATAILALPRCLGAWNAWRPPRPGSSGWARTGAFGLGLAAAGLLCSALFRCLAPVPAEPYFPRTALEALQARGADNVLVDFNWAQYALFQGAPRLKVAIDGRYEELYSPETMDRYFAWHFGTDGWRSLVDAPETHYALVERGSDRAQRLERLPGWTTVYADDLAVAFARKPQTP